MCTIKYGSPNSPNQSFFLKKSKDKLRFCSCLCCHRVNTQKHLFFLTFLTGHPFSSSVRTLSLGGLWVQVFTGQRSHGCVTPPVIPPACLHKLEAALSGHGRFLARRIAVRIRKSGDFLNHYRILPILAATLWPLVETLYPSLSTRKSTRKFLVEISLRAERTSVTRWRIVHASRCRTVGQK